MKRTIALMMVLAMAFSLVACSSNQEGNDNPPASNADGDNTSPTPAEAVSPADAEAGSIDLTVMMPLGQWTDNFNTLIDSYKAEHPEIGSIEATFPSSDKYEDLMKAALSAGALPDIISLSYGIKDEHWFQYCVDLSSGCSAYDLLTEGQLALGTTDYGMLIMPIYVEGTGILYNMRLLGEVGWDHTPQTRDELAQLCADLTAAGIKPFMHQWSETYLNLFNWVGPTWLGNKENAGLDFLGKMLAGENADLANDKEWNDFMDTYAILMQYAQEGAIATDKWTCRNAFFLEECAMLVGEGSWETPNIQNTNPALLDYVKQDVLPCSNVASENFLQLQTISAAVTDSGDPVRVAAAKEFLSYIVSSEAARVWHQEVMGSPTSIVTLELSENLPAVAADVVNIMKENRASESMYEWMPAVITQDLEEAWAKFVAGELSRDEFTVRYQEIFKNYSEGFYD
ncbi:MAG TPA: ABC transporter substrate-binding protein [Clostridia bacterium]|nr:ABC transporter substrate-binding protein [Clostridia bacterium]